tara:strand:+ start:225 stop:596 length:372 start_codon:yes stop_codon:yes gene_type:complete
MSGHRALTDNYLADTTVEDPGTGNTIYIARNPAIVELDHSAGGTGTRTLAAPQASGIIVTLTMKSDGGGTLTVTATNHTVAGADSLLFEDAGDTIMLVSVPSGTSGDFVWRMVEGTSGGVASS